MNLIHSIFIKIKKIIGITTSNWENLYAYSTEDGSGFYTVEDISDGLYLEEGAPS